MPNYPVVHLPSQLTSFIGRSDEIIEICQQLEHPDCHLLTLIGPGGIGKTRLAIEVAREKSSNFADGVYFVDLQPMNAVDALVTTLANSIDMRFFGEQPPRIQLLNFLRDRSVLLVIDNFEHLLGGIDLLSEVVKTAPNVKLLVTSREALNVQEEWLWQVKGLQFPENIHAAPIENFSAVRLFVERARRVRADFKLSNQENDVIRICRLVEGMPLALELAASWTKALSCDEIANEIQRSLDFLSSNSRNVPERHRSMQAVFNHSWKLLTDAERDVFPKLSVFRGGFRRDAAEAVAGASLETLVGLVDKSFLRVSQTGRYEVHELTRQYGERILEEARQKETVQDKHCVHFLNFLNEREPQLKGAAQIAALNMIDEELDNLRLSWRWAVMRRMDAELRKAALSLFLFYWNRGRYLEGEEIAALTGQALDTAEDAEWFLFWRWFRCRNGRSVAPKQMEKALMLISNSAVPERIIITLARLTAEVPSLNREELEQLHHRNLKHFESEGIAWGMGWSLAGLGELALQSNKLEEAERFYEKSAEVFRAIGNPWAMGWSLGSLGLVFCELKKYNKALLLLQEHQVINQTIGDINGVIWSLSVQGHIAVELQDFEFSRRCLIVGLDTGLKFGYNTIGLENLLWLLMRLLIKDSAIERGVEILGFFHQEARKIGADEFIQDIEHFLNSFLHQIPSETLQRAMGRGKTLNLKTVLAQVQAAFSIPLLPVNTSIPRHDTLTEREIEVLRLVADGLQNQEIADKLFITLGTVKTHINATYRKLDVTNRVQAISRARELQLL